MPFKAFRPMQLIHLSQTRLYLLHGAFDMSCNYASEPQMFTNFDILLLLPAIAICNSTHYLKTTLSNSSDISWNTKDMSFVHKFFFNNLSTYNMTECEVGSSHVPEQIIRVLPNTPSRKSFIVFGAPLMVAWEIVKVLEWVSRSGKKVSTCGMTFSGPH